MRRRCTSDPRPVSVIAKQPGRATDMTSGRYFLWCSSVPRALMAPPNRPNCTPIFTMRDMSATSISKATMEAPTSLVPPTDSGKP